LYKKNEKILAERIIDVSVRAVDALNPPHDIQHDVVVGESRFFADTFAVSSTYPAHVISGLVK
jgi:hypothetical protein